ncbi:DUF2066 domain-containing protein [Haliea sp.]|uniref:DUF2066 domain-containing protein n=1 Tax=Haliea sp. TaxID=1932666 RepID=UPI0035286BD0
MRAPLNWLAALLLLFACNAWPAELVRDLYVADIPVADRGEAELARAAAEGLAQVLVKVSGSVDVLQRQEIAPVLQGARARVQQYSYSRVDTGTAELSARVEFDPLQVRDLLVSAGAPIWTATRPAVLVWLVVEEAGERRFLSPGTHPELTAQLAEGFRRRGVPLRFPLLDLADAAALDPAEAWHLPSPLLVAASTRYRAGEVLAGRLAVLASGDVVGDWAYLSTQGRQARSVPRTEPGQFMQAGVELVVEDMAARYAISGVEAGDAVSLRVRGVSSYADYAAIISWLEGLEPIRQARLTALEEGTLTLAIVAAADSAQLASIIELNPRMRPAAGNTVGGLEYQWRN